jgi:hypothetical protein
MRHVRAVEMPQRLKKKMRYETGKKSRRQPANTQRLFCIDSTRLHSHHDRRVPRSPRAMRVKNIFGRHRRIMLHGDQHRAVGNRIIRR